MTVKVFKSSDEAEAHFLPDVQSLAKKSGVLEVWCVTQEGPPFLNGRDAVSGEPHYCVFYGYRVSDQRLMHIARYFELAA